MFNWVLFLQVMLIFSVWMWGGENERLLNDRVAVMWLFLSLVYQFSSVQSLNCVWIFATPRTAVHQASLSITNSRSLLKLMSIELVMPSNHLFLCRPLLPPSVFASIRVFSNESVLHNRWLKYWSFSFNISPSNDIQDWSPFG